LGNPQDGIGRTQFARYRLAGIYYFNDRIPNQKDFWLVSTDIQISV
jgi:hypothetical protein